MSVSRLAGRDRLHRLLLEECQLITTLEEIATQFEAAVGSGDMDAAVHLSVALAEPVSQLDAVQQAVAAAENDLIPLYAVCPEEQRQSELAEVLKLRQERTERLENYIARQQTGYDALGKYMNSLVDSGRNLNQAVDAFHEYRRAAQIDRQLLSVRK